MSHLQANELAAHNVKMAGLHFRVPPKHNVKMAGLHFRVPPKHIHLPKLHNLQHQQ